MLAFPRSPEELEELIRVASEFDIDMTILGGGANVVVSDEGITGIVIVTTELNTISTVGSTVTACAGAPISTVAAYAAERDLAGLDWIYAMPGSVGGAVWMNARCYGGEISEILLSVAYIDRFGAVGVYKPQPEDFSYKRSPFQDGRRIITAATFRLTEAPGGREFLWKRMFEIERDRREKGHFAAPCAGSIFKNDRNIGEPSGKIIDRLGLRGLRRGGAQVSPNHGNIIVNTGEATARDIRDLVTEIKDRVYRETGHLLDPEVLFLGEWS